MKKVVSVLLLTVLFLGAVSTTAFAHCGGRGMGYATCTVKGCTTLGLHEHNGVYYHCQNYAGSYRHGCGRGWNW